MTVIAGCPDDLSRFFRGIFNLQKVHSGSWSRVSLINGEKLDDDKCNKQNNNYFFHSRNNSCYIKISKLFLESTESE